MNLFATSPDWLIWLLAAALIAAALQDAAQLRISNLITAAVLAMAVIAAVLAGIEFALWQNLAVFVVLLTIGTMLFARGILGGGDVKLLAAVALWTDPMGAVRLLVAIFICGGLLALVILVLRMFAPERLTKRVATLRPKAGIPYGIAIAVGTLFIAATGKPDGPPAPYVPKGIEIQPR